VADTLEAIPVRINNSNEVNTNKSTNSGCQSSNIPNSECPGKKTTCKMNSSSFVRTGGKEDKASVMSVLSYITGPCLM